MQRWRDANKDKIKLDNRERRVNDNAEITCVCSSKIRKQNLSKHRKSKKHIQFIESQNENN